MRPLHIHCKVRQAGPYTSIVTLCKVRQAGQQVTRVTGTNTGDTQGHYRLKCGATTSSAALIHGNCWTTWLLLVLELAIKHQPLLRLNWWRRIVHAHTITEDGCVVPVLKAGHRQVLELVPSQHSTQLQTLPGI